MKSLLVTLFVLLASQNIANAKTDWTYQDLSGGMALLTGTFDPKGTAVIYSCINNYVSSGVILLNKPEWAQINTVEDTRLKITSYDNETVNFMAGKVPTHNKISIFASADQISSITAFHFLDVSNGKDMHIKIDNNSLSIRKTGIIQTDNARQAISQFKDRCPILN